MQDKPKATTIKNRILIVVIAIVVLFATFVAVFNKTIFQRGNPIPYFFAMVKINDNQPYVELGSDSQTYVTKNDGCPELIKHIESDLNVEFIEQAGNAYMFTDGFTNTVVGTEIYLSKYRVWEVSSSPHKKYILENYTDKDKFEKMIAVILYDDGRARLPQPMISSFLLPESTYEFVGDELLIFSPNHNFDGELRDFASNEGRDDVVAAFTVEDENTLVFKSATVPLFTNEGARYVKASDGN